MVKFDSEFKGLIPGLLEQANYDAVLDLFADFLDRNNDQNAPIEADSLDYINNQLGIITSLNIDREKISERVASIHQIIMNKVNNMPLPSKQKKVVCFAQDVIEKDEMRILENGLQSFNLNTNYDLLTAPNIDDNVSEISFEVNPNTNEDAHYYEPLDEIVPRWGEDLITAQFTTDFVDNGKPGAREAKNFTIM